MRFEKKDRIAIFIVIFGVAFILWYSLFYLPKTKKIKHIKEQVKSLQEQNEVFSRMIFALIQARKEGERVSIKYNELITQLPRKETMSNAIDQLKEAAKNNHIEMQILSVQLIDTRSLESNKDNSEFHLTDVPSEIALYGDFFGIVEYLSYLIQRPYFKGYTQLSMEKTEGAHARIKVRIACKFLVLNDSNDFTNSKSGGV